MGEPAKNDIPLLAGAGGVTLGEARTNHQGRKAILMIRDGENSDEFEALVATMGIEIVERLNQSGKEDPRSYFGKGRLQDVADELAATVDGHPWKSVDLVLIHNNAAARQLVAVSDAVKVEVMGSSQTVTISFHISCILNGSTNSSKNCPIAI